MNMLPLESKVSKHPDQEGVETFHRKVQHYKGVPQREAPNAMGNGRADYLIPQIQWPLNQSPSPASMMATSHPAPVKKQSRDRNLLRKRKNQSLVPEAVRPESLPPSSIGTVGLCYHYQGPYSHEKSTTTATASNTKHVHSSARVVEGPNTFLVPPLPFFIQQPQPAATTSTIATNQRDRSDDPMKYVTEGIPAQVLETNTDSSNDTDAAAPTVPQPKVPRTHTTTTNPKMGTPPPPQGSRT
ncbi:hypothetical protein Pelo_3288 [Pelomyxa schiedti]|nr:hypothetical protein Pelo_3288 [Pelomyxa schiedti]